MLSVTATARASSICKRQTGDSLGRCGLRTEIWQTDRTYTPRQCGPAHTPRLEFAKSQRNWTARRTDSWREPAEDTHQQGENDAADEQSRRDAESESQV